MLMMVIAWDDEPGGCAGNTNNIITSKPPQMETKMRYKRRKVQILAQNSGFITMSGSLGGIKSCGMYNIAASSH